MIAVIYSGSNYADWRLADKGKTVASFKTNAINPYFDDEKNAWTKDPELDGLLKRSPYWITRIFREVRPFRIYDGPSEVHRWSIAQRVLRGG